ncbi:hypothetical protein F383_20496 [Gossypium arboreum]|uniref:Uncharacterized protein n=1 Tax=Gossypium arboreum TaxID=29729 RepID=A0A0B0MGS0_GOSAR|nr:hypothetical protein F383_20496 [Gossypium arboreum]
MASHARVPGRVLGRTKTIGYIDLCHTVKSHTRVLCRGEHTYLVFN